MAKAAKVHHTNGTSKKANKKTELSKGLAGLRMDNWLIVTFIFAAVVAPIKTVMATILV